MEVVIDRHEINFICTQSISLFLTLGFGNDDMNQNKLLDIAAFTPNSLQFPNAWAGHLPFAAWVIREVKPKIFVELAFLDKLCKIFCDMKYFDIKFSSYLVIEHFKSMVTI